MSVDRNPVVQDVGSAPKSSRANALFFGSAGMAFGALMAMLKANLDTMNSMAQLNIATTQARLSAVNSTATETESMYSADARVLSLNGSEQYANMASSFAQAGMGGGAFGFSLRATRFSNKMGNLSQEAHTFKPGANNLAGDSDSDFDSSTALSPERQAVVDRFTAKLKSANGFTADDCRELFKGKAGKTLLDHDLGEGITLKHILSRADAADLPTFHASLKAGVKAAYKESERSQDTIRTFNQVGQNTAQGASAAAQSQFKMSEANATTEKGAAAAALAENQASQQFSQETSQKQQEQVQTLGKHADEVWTNYVALMVQMDNKG